MNAASLVFLLIVCNLELCHVAVRARNCTPPATFPKPRWAPLPVSAEGRSAEPRRGSATNRQLASIAAFTGAIAGAGAFVSGGVDTVFNIFKTAEIGVDGFFGWVKRGQDLTKLLGIDEKEILITIDVKCKSTCRMWIRCYSFLNIFTWYDWVEVEEDDGGYCMRFNTRLHYWAQWLGTWQCDFKQDDTGKSVMGMFVFGGKAPKTHTNMYNLKTKRVQRMDPELKQVDGRQPSSYF